MLSSNAFTFILVSCIEDFHLVSSLPCRAHTNRPSQLGPPGLVADRNVSREKMGDAFNGSAPEIRTQRLTLRRLSVDDASAVYDYASDQEVARFTLWPSHSSEEFTRKFLANLTSETVLSWAILMQETHEIAGMVFFHSLVRHHRKAEIAFNLGRRFWKKGIATEAATAALNFAFGPLGLNRVEATCMPANSGSRRVLEKLGMSREGTLRRSHCRHDGFHDMDLFSILADEPRG